MARGELLSQLRDHLPTMALVVSYAAGSMLVAYHLGMEHGMRLGLYWKIIAVGLIPVAVATIVGRVVWVATAVVRGRREPRGSLFGTVGRDLVGYFLEPARIAMFGVMMMVVSLLVGTYGSIKQVITAVRPFNWDYMLMRADYVLHGGQHPWELLQPIVGRPAITFGISVLYAYWFVLLFGTIFWQAWSRDGRTRQQFLLSCALVWLLLGTVLAWVFLSAGPCYYGRVTGGADPYAPLMAYLRRVNESYPVWSLAIQERLWIAYEGGKGGQAMGGISAMPSVHVAMVTLLALLAWSRGRWLGAVVTVYAAVILIGSVHLGWHYAVDGYVSVMATILIWVAVGRWLQHRERRRSHLVEEAGELALV